MKKILVVYYSQTAQTDAAAKSILNLIDSTINVDYFKLEPKNDYLFPWEIDRFFSVMPESVLQQPIPMAKLDLSLAENYDLVVLAYQPWFLSISLPMLSFLHSDQGKNY